MTLDPVGDPPTRVFLKHVIFPFPEEDEAATDLADLRNEIAALFPSISKAGNLVVDISKIMFAPIHICWS